MKLTSFHLDGSRVYLAPIGPGFNVVHCPTGNRAAPVSESLRAVLFGAMLESGWPTAEGGLVGSVDVSDEWGSGRVSRRNVGHGMGPLELSLHDGRSPELTHRIEEMARSAGSYQIIDFGNGRELTELALRVCSERLEIAPERTDYSTDYSTDTDREQWRRRRESLQQREQELLALRNRLTAEHEDHLRRSRTQPQEQPYSIYGGPHREEQLAHLRQRQVQLGDELTDIERRLARDVAARDETARDVPSGDAPPHAAASGPFEAPGFEASSSDTGPRIRSLDAQMDRIEQVCDDLDARLADINHQLQGQERGEQPAVERSWEELRGMAAALERQLSWLDSDRHSAHQASYEAERWEVESGELRRTVSDLLQTITRQERSLTVDTLRNEAKQIRRCRSSLRQRLRRLWAVRERMTRPDDNRRATHGEHDPLQHRRDELRQQLRQAESDMDRLRSSADQSRYEGNRYEQAKPTATLAALLSRIESTEAELASVRRELQREPDVAAPAHSSRAAQSGHPAYAPAAVTRRPADQQLMHHAAMQLSQLSEGELVSLRYDAPTNTLFVTDYEGKPHASYDLPLDVQRLVALSLLLSFADARFPVVLDRVFEETPETATASVLEVLRDSCRDGMQILAIVYDNQVADRLNELQVDIRHADWAAPQEHAEPQEAGAAEGYLAPSYMTHNGIPAQNPMQGYAAYGYGPAYAQPPYGIPPHPAMFGAHWGPYAQMPPPMGDAAPGSQPTARHWRQGTRAAATSGGGSGDSFVYTPQGATIWDSQLAGPDGKPSVRKTVTPQAVRIFEDSYRPVLHTETHSHRHHLDYPDSVNRIPYFGRDFAERLEQYGYWTVADFLRGDADEMVQQLSGEVTIGELRQWQAQCQLMCGIARLRAFDAKILVACGISDPLQLQSMPPREMMQRVAVFMDTPRGQQMIRSGTPFEISRIKRWIGAADGQGDSDGRTGRYSRRVGAAPKTARKTRRRASSDEDNGRQQQYENGNGSIRAAHGDYDQDRDVVRDRDHDHDRDRDRDREVARRVRYEQEQDAEYAEYAELDEEGEGEVRGSRRFSSGESNGSGGRSSRSGKSRSSRSGSSRSGSSRSSRSSRSGSSRSDNSDSGGRSDSDRSSRSGSRSARLLSTESQSSGSTSSGGVLTFYLDMHSDVEAAPTIGPKTAELLYEIGIHTVGHLLEATPAEVAEQLDHARISANNVLEWQLQSALVCRVPELRGHDSQILVACGVTEAEQLAAYDPDELYGLVEPFVGSKAGKRIVRNGKAPDLEEIGDWVRWAKQARQLKAA